MPEHNVSFCGTNHTTLGGCYLRDSAIAMAATQMD